MPGMNASFTIETCKFDGHTYTSQSSKYGAHPAKFCTSVDRSEADVGLHFQFPPTMGFLDDDDDDELLRCVVVVLIPATVTGCVAQPKKTKTKKMIMTEGV